VRNAKRTNVDSIDPGMLPTERESNGISIRKYLSSDNAAIVEAVQESVATVGAWLDWCSSGYGRSDADAWIAVCAAAGPTPVNEKATAHTMAIHKWVRCFIAGSTPDK